MTAQILPFPAPAAAHWRDESPCRYRLQPIVDLRRGALRGLEFLVRAAGRRVPATQFLAYLRGRGRLAALDLQTATAAAAFHAELARCRRPSPALHLNLCPETLADRSASDRLIAQLQDRPALAAAVVFEVTEGSRLGAVGFARLGALRRRGARIAIDDFGTGHAGYDRLSQDAFDVVKLDKSLIARLDAPRPRAIVASLVRLADEMGVELIAEGIETALQKQILTDLGGRFGQGYLCGRPVAPARMLALCGGAPAAAAKSLRRWR